MIPRSFRSSDMPLIFGTSDPNISNEDFLEKVETNFRVNNNSSSIASPEDIINGLAEEIASKNAFHVSKILDQSFSPKKRDN